jgi:hypothetical protein
MDKVLCVTIVSVIVIIYYIYKEFIRSNELYGVWAVDGEFAKKADIEELSIVIGKCSMWICMRNPSKTVDINDIFHYNITGNKLKIFNFPLWPNLLIMNHDREYQHLSLMENDTTMAILFKNNELSYYTDYTQLNNKSTNMNIDTIS